VNAFQLSLVSAKQQGSRISMRRLSLLHIIIIIISKTASQNYLLTYSMEHKLNGYQLAKKFPAFYETQNFITAFASARHLSLSSVISI
jgi:hypothetical protein